MPIPAKHFADITFDSSETDCLGTFPKRFQRLFANQLLDVPERKSEMAKAPMQHMSKTKRENA